MRNLEVTRCAVLPSSPLLCDASCLCVDSDSGSVWAAAKAGLCCIVGKEVSLVPLVENGHMTPDDSVVGLEYVSELESVCVATRKGNILLCQTHTLEVECVGTVSGGGLVCMGWSPEQDLAVFVTGEENLLLMTRGFDPICETSTHPEEFGEAMPVTIGWGKKATQFHGSAGKASREQVSEKPLSPALPWDDRKPRISWRGDGEYFVCSTIDSHTGARRLRVWSRDCVLHSTSELLDSVEQSLHWRPSGNLIASTQHRPHQHNVVFFERNGLQHGEFTLEEGGGERDTKRVYVRELQWSCDSSVLALWMESVVDEKEEEESSGNERPESYVQLWCMSNYHWYLKQELHLPSPALAGMQWDPISPLTLHLLTLSGQYLCYTWRWVVAQSLAHTAENKATIAVIDGTHIHLTPFRDVIIPPPMCHHDLLLPSPVLQIVFAPPPHCNDFLALLASGEVAVFCCRKLHTQGNTTPCPELVAITRLDGSPFCLHSLRQLVWWQESQLLGVVLEGEGEAVVELSLHLDRDTHCVEVKTCRTTLIPKPLLCLTANPDTQTAIAQLIDGTILRYDSGCLLPWQLPSGQELRFPEQACDHTTLATFNRQEHVVGLSESRRTLYVDDRPLAAGCISFAVHDEFLLLTTTSHTCRFLPLHSNPSELSPLHVDRPHALDEMVRRVERGSRIVTAIPRDIRVILQMPRGNLETICPRALVLSSVRGRLDRLEFREAFIIMRKHRINLNLIYDHNPQAFLANTKQFVCQLDSVSYVNLFLTELSIRQLQCKQQMLGDEDVTRTMYPILDKLHSVCEREKEEEVEGGGGKKVDRVCDTVREALVELGENKYLLSIITTHIKKTTPELEVVLQKVKHLKECPPESHGEGPSVTAEEALKFSLFLVDVNQLYDVALGMYDFSLVLMVAERSQKDPKEYLPFLNKLRRLPLHYQHYQIDWHLRRYHKALQHISKCGPEKFDECLGLVREHSLYTEALTIYSDRSTPEYKAIARAYGAHLAEKDQHRDAGIIFAQCGCLCEAMVSFEKAGCWQQVFSLSAQLHQDPVERMEVARRVAGSLRISRQWCPAARVLLDYAEDVEEAVVTLLEGGVWEEALRIAHLHRRTDLIETHLKPSLLEAHQSQLSVIETLQCTFVRHTSRLAMVREQKEKKQAALLEGTYAADERDADLFSDTSSITGRSALGSVSSSMASKSSGRSSKNRRKAERKKHSLREGSAYEDIALLEALGETVGTVDKMQEEICSLLGMLVQYGFTFEASEVQTSFSQLLATVRSKIPSIWQPPTLHPITSTQKLTGPESTANSIAAAMTSSLPLPQAMTTVTADTTAPTLPRLRDMRWKLDMIS